MNRQNLFVISLYIFLTVTLIKVHETQAKCDADEHGIMLPCGPASEYIGQPAPVSDPNHANIILWLAISAVTIAGVALLFIVLKANRITPKHKI